MLISQYKVTQVRPFLLAIIECYGQKKITQDQAIKTIVSLERFHFVFSTLCQDRASGLEGKYTRAAKNLHNSTSKAEAKQVLQDLIAYLNQKRPKETRVAEAISKLRFDSDYDNDKKTIQTIFSKLEAHLTRTEELAINAFSLEHISDQSAKDEWCSTVGNLIPLAEAINNGIGQNKTFEVKKKHYKRSELKIVAEFLTLNTQEKFTKANAEKWEHVISEKLYKATNLLSI